MPGGYFNVSGLVGDDAPSDIFVWCRSKGAADYALIDTGQAVSPADVRPPGISVGQFSVTFLLPPDCAIESLIVTSDRDVTAPLSNLVVTPCT